MYQINDIKFFISQLQTNTKMKITVNFEIKKVKFQLETEPKYAPDLADIIISITEKENCEVSINGDNEKVVDLAQYLIENHIKVSVNQEFLPLLEKRLEEDEIDAFPPTGKKYPTEIRLEDLPF